MFIHSVTQVNPTLIEEIDAVLGISPDSFYQPVVIVCSFIVMFYLLFFVIKVLINICETGTSKW